MKRGAHFVLVLITGGGKKVLLDQKIYENQQEKMVHIIREVITSIDGEMERVDE
jgi:ribose 1,5-bisphosphokinase PhnN